jgi:hypothetical protein
LKKHHAKKESRDNEEGRLERGYDKQTPIPATTADSDSSLPISTNTKQKWKAYLTSSQILLSPQKQPQTHIYTPTPSFPATGPRPVHKPKKPKKIV